MNNAHKKKNTSIKSQKQQSIDAIKNGAQAVTIKGTASATYEGPLPPPEILRGFAEIHPDAVELIFDEFKKNSDHVRTMEQKKLESDNAIAKRGQWMAFILGIFLILLAVCAVFIGAPWIAGGALFIAVAGIARAAISSRTNQKK